MNEFIKLLIMVAIYLSSLLIASIADDRIRNGAYRIATIFLIGVMAGIAIMSCLNLKVV